MNRVMGSWVIGVVLIAVAFLTSDGHPLQRYFVKCHSVCADVPEGVGWQCVNHGIWDNNEGESDTLESAIKDLSEQICGEPHGSYVMCKGLSCESWVQTTGDVIKNGTFADGADHWHFRCTNWFVYNAGTDRAILHANDVKETHSQPSVYQDISGIPKGGSVTFSVSLKKDADGVDRTVEVVIWETGGGSDLKSTTHAQPLTTTWKTFRVSQVKERQNSQLRAEIYWNDHSEIDIQIDNAKFVINSADKVRDNSWPELKLH